jgi:hypothetical protein
MSFTFIIIKKKKNERYIPATKPPTNVYNTIKNILLKNLLNYFFRFSFHDALGTNSLFFFFNFFQIFFEV